MDFPKAFNYGKSCCHYDKDNQDNIISSPSQTCKDDAYRPCQKDHCIDNSNKYDYIIVPFQIWMIYYFLRIVIVFENCVLRHLTTTCNLNTFHIQLADDTTCAVGGETYNPSTKRCQCGSESSCTFSDKSGKLWIVHQY